MPQTLMKAESLADDYGLRQDLHAPILDPFDGEQSCRAVRMCGTMKWRTKADVTKAFEDNEIWGSVATLRFIANRLGINWSR